MAIRELDVKRFLVCSTGEEVIVPKPDDSYEAAVDLCTERQVHDDTDETWSVVAELNI